MRANSPGLTCCFSHWRGWRVGAARVVTGPGRVTRAGNNSGCHVVAEQSRVAGDDFYDIDGLWFNPGVIEGTAISVKSHRSCNGFSRCWRSDFFHHLCCHFDNFFYRFDNFLCRYRGGGRFSFLYRLDGCSLCNWLGYTFDCLLDCLLRSALRGHGCFDFGCRGFYILDHSCHCWLDTCLCNQLSWLGIVFRACLLGISGWLAAAIATTSRRLCPLHVAGALARLVAAVSCFGYFSVGGLNVAVCCHILGFRALTPAIATAATRSFLALPGVVATRLFGALAPGLLATGFFLGVFVIAVLGGAWLLLTLAAGATSAAITVSVVAL